jgi:transcriptional regulator with GAF, ATPase, and Fis domain/CHASE2 domain-containing sensor protein
MRRSLVAALIGVAAVLGANGLVAVGGSSVAAVEWTARAAVAPVVAPVSATLVLVARDATSEARLGSTTWDRAVLARALSALTRAGAAAVGLDSSPGQPSAPGRGGAASDALLAHAIVAAGNVVVAVASLDVGGTHAPPARAVGHSFVTAEADGIVHRALLALRREGREIHALGVALAAVSRDVPPAQVLDRIPTDGDGAALLRWAPDLHVVPFSEVWSAIESGDVTRLRALVQGKTVMLVTEPAAVRHVTPIGPLSDIAVQAELLNAIQTGAWLRPAPRALVLLGSLVLAALAAWLGLAPRTSAAVAGTALVVVAEVAALAQVPAVTGVVIPVLAPLAAGLAASVAALLWRQVGAGRRLRRLEGEVHGMREALVRQESTVETLEEDLEAARVAVERSTGTERDLLQAAEALREQLASARAQEEATRARLHALEHDRRPASAGSASLPDADLERLRRQAAEVGIVTRDPTVLAQFRDLQKAARASLPILLAGEPGTGKELFARAAHRLSSRAAGTFVAVNAAAIPPELFESEMFGHVRGSFTGAVGDRKGYFEQADGGTLFLDEIGELRAEHQGKLLRVLQEGTFHRVGATRATTVDVRMVTASNRDLGRGVVEGWFREDLYFRLRGLVLTLPPLRERSGDVPLLAERFLDGLSGETGRRVRLSEAAVRTLERHDWPGNVRELQSCLRRAVALSDREVLASEDLALQSPGGSRPDGEGDAAVLDCLRRNGFDMQATARRLGWDRSTVTQRLKGLGFQALVESGGDRARAAAALAGDPALARTVEVKLGEYQEHLMRSVAAFDSADAAVVASRRRFKNLPERYFAALETLVRQRFK